MPAYADTYIDGLGRVFLHQSTTCSNKGINLFQHAVLSTPATLGIIKKVILFSRRKHYKIKFS